MYEQQQILGDEIIDWKLYRKYSFHTLAKEILDKNMELVKAKFAKRDNIMMWPFCI